MLLLLSQAWRLIVMCLVAHISVQGGRMCEGKAVTQLPSVTLFLYPGFLPCTSVLDSGEGNKKNCEQI